MITILEDKGQKENKHRDKNLYWQLHGVQVIRKPLPIGDYILGTDRVMDVINRKDKRGIPVKKMDFVGAYTITIDSKYSIQELVSDVCGKQHERFRDELILAQNNGVDLIILVENTDGITTLSELHKWVNPRLFIKQRGGGQKYPKATRGVTLMKSCYTLQQKYGCQFLFCKPDEAGRMIVELLTRGTQYV